jgi:hypothetical protein
MEMSRGGRRTGSGRKPESDVLKSVKNKEATRYLYGRLKQMRDLGTEGAKKEANKIALVLLKHELPMLQAVMSQTLIESGDTLKNL